MDVLVDINKVNDAKSVYKKYASEMKDTLSKLKSSVDRIETQWQGVSKDSFGKRINF